MPLLKSKSSTPKLLRVGAGAQSRLAASTNCCCKLAIIIWNSNQQKDDNFRIELNGTLLGLINNSTNTCTGGIISEGGLVNSSNLVPGVICATPDFSLTAALNMGLLVLPPASNVLRIESVFDNNNGNFGDVRIADMIFNPVAAKYSVGIQYLSGVYSFPDGVGQFQNFSFTYP